MRLAGEVFGIDGCAHSMSIPLMTAPSGIHETENAAAVIFVMLLGIGGGMCSSHPMYQSLFGYGLHIRNCCEKN